MIRAAAEHATHSDGNASKAWHSCISYTPPVLTFPNADEWRLPCGGEACVVGCVVWGA